MNYFQKTAYSKLLITTSFQKNSLLKTTYLYKTAYYDLFSKQLIQNSLFKTAYLLKTTYYDLVFKTAYLYKTTCYDLFSKKQLIQNRLFRQNNLL